MDPVVTARVPAGVKTRGVEVLREIGSTTSELINAAFEYVIRERELPHPKATGPASPLNRALDPARQQELTDFMDSVRTPVPTTWADLPFEDLLDRAMEERYAHLR